MSILVATGSNYLTRSSIQSQIMHVQDMATSRNDIPYVVGDFTTDPTKNLRAPRLHKDGYGFYAYGEREVITKSIEPLYEQDASKIAEVSPTRSKVSFVHARMTSSGSKNVQNNQPFNLDYVVGTHNGTVEGIAEGDKSDSQTVMRVMNSYIARDSSLNPRDIERTIIDKIVRPSSRYMLLNLMLYAKKQGKVIVVCSYEPNEARTVKLASYVSMVIAQDDEKTYVSSERDLEKIVRNSKKRIRTRNNTMYIIDQATGIIQEYYMKDLEKAVMKQVKARNKQKNKSGKRRSKTAKTTRKAA
ncbi:class II glutamine amidotransferase [Candidatus Woesearchaeota archaeon]|nr:class II glutamine amidotransferase [Candidatus Woesearchaeota archaeon]